MKPARPRRSFWTWLRNTLVAGLIVLLPVVTTAYLLWVLFRFADGLLGQFVAPYLPFPMPGLGLALTAIIVFLFGVLATQVVGRRLIRGAEAVLLRTPLVRTIFITLKQMVEAVAHNERGAFRRVVMVEYPRKGVYSIGFITGDGFPEARQHVAGDLVSVFVPTTPNPTSGMMVVVPRSQVTLLDMPVDDGMKLVVSGGVITPSGRAQGGPGPHGEGGKDR